ncbi:MAG: sialidase, partial [bacterium]|nr:sialidase [bacterium]
KSWSGVQLPVAQMYHVYVDNRVPYYVYGNRQDGTSYRGPSNSRTFGKLPPALWHPVAGFESGFAVPDPVDENIVWSGNYDGMLDRFDLSNGQYRSVDVWPEGMMGRAAADVKYRFQWTFPICISPHDHNRVYVGSQHVHVTTDGGHSWKVISPDLSTNDKSKQQITGGLTRDDPNPMYACVIFALTESPLQKGLLWAGTNDGLLHVSKDNGASWTNVTKNIPVLPPWGTFSNIEASRFEAGTCYITVDFHQENNRDPFVYKTHNYGQKWIPIHNDLPKSVLSYAHCIKEDPVRKGMLYLGTENRLHFSLNDGKNWLPLQTNLPHAPVHWLALQEHFGDLVVATYGRGFWILDDITPLRQLSDELLESDSHLFAPRPAYRFHYRVGPEITPNSQCAGKNPPYGAIINYFLKSKPDKKTKIFVTIFDEKGNIVRTLKKEEKSKPGSLAEAWGCLPVKVPRKKGINRLVWDLRHGKSKKIKLRTPPPGAKHIRVGPKGWRKFPWGDEIPGPLAAPGIYTVKL